MPMGPHWNDIRGKPAAAGGAEWASITGKPATFPPSTHTHPQSDVTGLTGALAGKSDTGHTHATVDVTGLDATLAGLDADKEDAAGRGVANGYASLDASGVIPEAQIPSSIRAAINDAAWAAIVAAERAPFVNPLESVVFA